MASHEGFGGHPRAVRPSPDMCSTITYPQYAWIIRQDDPWAPNHRFGVISNSNSTSPPGKRDDMWRATEALAAIPGRFDRLQTCAQLSHTRSTRGSSARTIPWAPNHRFVLISNSNSNSPPGGQDDVWRAMEALAAIPGRFDRLLTCAQLSHTRSTRGSAVKSLETCLRKISF